MYQQFSTNVKPCLNDFYNPLARRLLQLSTALISTPKPSLPDVDPDIERRILDLWHVDSREAIAGEELAQVIEASEEQALFWGDAAFVYASNPFRVSLLPYGAYDIDSKGVLKVGGEKPFEASLGQYSILRFKRLDKHRGMSSFASCIQYLHDYQEILKNYREAIKTSSKINIVRTSEAPEGTPLTDLFPTADSDGNTLTRAEMRNAVESGGWVDLPEGQDLKILADNRPAPEQAAFLELLKTGVAEAYGLPPEIAFDLSSLKGASTRLRTAEVNRFIERNRAIVERIYSQIFGRWVVERVIIPDGITDAATVAKLIKPKWVFPAPLTVDERYTSQTALALIDKGLMSRTEYCAAYSRDYRATAAEIASEMELLPKLP